MPVNAKLLSVLCCPHTKIPVEIVDEKLLSALNQRVKAGDLIYTDGSKVDEMFSQALITKNKELIYRVDDDIPVMIYENAVAADQIDVSE